MGLTAAEVAALSVVAWTGADERMRFYNAVAHAFTTMPTGGFSTQARSIEALGVVSQWIIVVFMILAGVNFALMYRTLVRRDVRVIARDEEFRLYLALLLLGSVVLLAELWSRGFAGEEALRQAAFQAVSMMTTTGYAVTDFNAWFVAAPLAAMVLVAPMFPGGSAGSTAGSTKVVRHVVIGKMLRGSSTRRCIPSWSLRFD